ncbi:MAG: nucleotidyltransferase domain-containing protein [Sulfolobales archaeon]
MLGRLLSMRGRQLPAELARAVEILVEMFKPIAIILFGSRARGDYKPWSDYDILIIADFDKSFLDRIGDIFEALSNIDLPIEPHLYTLEEALNMLDKGNPIIIDSLSEGLVLYKTPEFDKLVEKLDEMIRKGLRKSETTIILPKNI